MAGEDRERESGVICSWREARVGSGRAPRGMFRILDFIPEASREPAEHAMLGFAFHED